MEDGDAIHQWLSRFGLDEHIHTHVAAVLTELPEGVREDLMGDPLFIVSDFEPGASRFIEVVVRFDGKTPGRSVLLKRTLRRASHAFARWVIAHEFAHAHLRQGGRWAGEDPELAADALAAQWGFPRPLTRG